VLVGEAAVAGYVYSNDNLSEQVTRTMYFWKNAFPVYLRYRYTQWRVSSLPQAQQDVEYNKLHDRYAEEILQIVLHLKGLYIKLAQIGSTRNDFVPKQYMERFSTLQDKVPAKDGAFARRMVEESLGGKLEDLFAEFDPEALGAASIGQVHSAKLKDGTEVVVKIQYPEVRRLFKLDIANSRLFARIAQPEYVPLLDEIEKQLNTEFDFRREGKMLEVIGNNIMPVFGNEVWVPKPIPGMITEKVLVMEKVPGIKLVDGIKQLFGEIAKAQGMTLDELREKAEKKPPTAGQMEAFKWKMWAVSKVNNTKAGLYNWFVGPFTGKRAEYVKPLRFIDEKKVMSTLLRVHGHQIFVDGVFNGDCHPGNIILMPDGRLGLIDYGQVKEIDKQTRRELATMIELLAKRDSEQVVAHFKKMGFKTKKMDPYIIEKNAVVFFDRCDREVTEGMNLQLFLDKLTATDATVVFPEEHLFAARTSLLLRGLGTILGHPVSTASAWLPFAHRVLKETAC
jgi:aarF domain-containing kinase